MRKVLFLAIALVTSVCGAWADVVTPKASNATKRYYYKMHCLAKSGHENAQYLSINDGTIAPNSSTGTDFIFESAGDNQWYIQDAASGKYLVVASETANTAITLSETATTYWTTGGPFHEVGIRLYPNGNTSCWMNNVSNSLALRTGTGECSSWVLEEEVKGVENALNGRSEELSTSENLTSGKFYVISGYDQSTENNHFLYDNDGSFATQGTMTTGQDDSSKFAWRLVKNGEGLWSFQNAHSGKYITFEGSGDNSPVTMGEEEKFYTIHWNEDGNIAAFKNSNGQGIDLAANGTAALTWTDNGTVGGSRRMRIYEAEVVSTIISSYTYTVSVSGVAGGALVYNEANYTNNATIEGLASPLAIADLAAAPVEGYNGFVTLNGSAIIVTYLPAAANVEGLVVNSVGEKVTSVESGKWYIITQTRGGTETPAYATNDNKLYRAAAANTVANVATKGTTASDIAQYLVRFVDSDVAGAKYIQFANGKFWGSAQQSGNVKLDAATDHADKYIVYQIGETHVGFSQTTDGTTYGRKVDNDGVGSTVGYWESGTVTQESSNAAWYVYPVEIGAPTIDWELFEARLNSVKAYTLGTGLGEYACTIYEQPVTASQMSYYKDAWQETLNDQEEGNYTTNMTEMNEALASMQLNMPQPGQFFRIKTSSNWIATPTYLKGEQNSSNRVLFTQDAAEIAGTNTIFCYFLDPKTNGKYLVCYGNGMTAANNSNFMGMKRYPSTTSIAFQAATTGEKVGKYNIKFAGSRFLYTNNGLYGDAGSGSTAEGYNFVFEEVTELPVAFHENGQGYATLYSPAALEIPEGVEAYTLHEGEDEYLHANQLTDVIPANTAVVLKGTAGETEDFVVTTGGTVDTENVLIGTVPAAAAGEGKYVFSIVGGNAGFYKFGGNDLAGFKAYYVSGNTEVQGFVINFGDKTTGINAAQQAQGQKASFDLQGRRISKAVRGLFIQNGQKVIR
ncbi:MAG: hypothetical protein MJZ40_00545 [Bacteroidaceae bacterium]|nr:hypothetical protein [Bacteroidaceae bacterium]